MTTAILLTIDELRKSVKNKVAVTDYLEITQAMIDRFADVTKDNQWIHTDATRAALESPFKTTIAHGFLTLSLLSVLVNETVKVKNVRYGINYGFNYVRFVSPVAVGAKIRAHLTPNEVKDVTNAVQIVWNVLIETQDSASPALVADWIVRYY